MAVFRVNKNKDYTVMSNHHLKDKNLSLKAKGLLSQMLSLPDDWDYTVAGLCAINEAKMTTVKSALAELKKENYLKITKLMPNKTESGRIEYIYDIYEQPIEKQPIEKQPIEKQPIEKQPLENQQQLNTNILNTNKLNTNNISVPAQICAEKLKKKILEIYPNNAGAKKKDCVERWGKDIDKMNRLDGRSWEDIEKAIDWAMKDTFWQKNIWSGASLRKHYDRLEADARADFMKHGVITVGI